MKTPVFESLFNRDSNTGVFLWILQKILKHLFYRAPPFVASLYTKAWALASMNLFLKLDKYSLRFLKLDKYDLLIRWFRQCIIKTRSFEFFFRFYLIIKIIGNDAFFMKCFRYLSFTKILKSLQLQFWRKNEEKILYLFVYF